MRHDDIPVKTREGLAEIKTRTRGLAPRMRTALLLVDGVKTVCELEELLAASGVKPGALQTLAEKGLISVGDSAPSAEAPVTATATDPAPDANPVTASPVSLTTDIVAVQETREPREPPSEPQQPPLQPVGEPPATATVPALAKAEGDSTNVASAEAPATAGPAAPEQAHAAVSAPAPAQASPPTPSKPPQQAVQTTPVPTPPPATPAACFGPAAPPADMRLMLARAHVANALDDRLDSYVLRQMIANCSSRAELLSLFDAAESALRGALGSTRSAQVMTAARTLLHS